MQLESRVAVITGGATGIGADIGRKLASEGAKVVLCDIDTAQGEATASSIRGAKFIMLDVSQDNVVNEVVDRITSEYSRIDILVNNAGVTRDRLMLRMERADWDFVINVNLTGTFLVSRAIIKLMVKQKYGRIINIASVIGLTGNSGQANYAASKAGIIGFTKSCAKELASRNITVNAVAPGFIETRMTGNLSEEVKQNYLKMIPLKRFGTTDDVASVVLFLASDAASYITGQVMTVDGGLVM
ncbi:3-oxoacyl-[acyl-carrier-protein] reductase [candidate division WOR-3 bacterium RBG_13_43_14]|uniref:3-oxoacyl-[acyl-carrier-protein] reductase n=1 Tax=candidate division WOR-3 bacterium RBG_13_43_14 TaxID=1802590 RepID=A0A1F4UBH6_UNCW3|nr:MAG: 3-oxoacyl-[acyl-carrier-protein] reductase [candidate division WOR-3 bacterium RBG_13_43_14]